MIFEDVILRNKKSILEITNLRDDYHNKIELLKEVLGDNISVIEQDENKLELQDTLEEPLYRYIIPINKERREQLVNSYIFVIKQGFKWLLPFKVKPKSFYYKIPVEYKKAKDLLNETSIIKDITEKSLCDFLDIDYEGDALENIKINNYIEKNITEASSESQLTPVLVEALTEQFGDIIIRLNTELKNRGTDIDETMNQLSTITNIYNTVTKEWILEEKEIKIHNCSIPNLTLNDLLFYIKKIDDKEYDVNLSIINFPKPPFIKYPLSAEMGHLYQSIKYMTIDNNSSPAYTSAHLGLERLAKSIYKKYYNKNKIEEQILFNVGEASFKGRFNSDINISDYDRGYKQLVQILLERRLEDVEVINQSDVYLNKNKRLQDYQPAVTAKYLSTR